jgi:hypothetical protein
MEIESIYSRE